MKLSIEQIVDSKEVLGKLGGMPFKAITSYKIQRNIRKLSPELIDFEKALKIIVEKHADLKGEQYEIRESEKEEYQKEVQELIKLEVEVDIAQVKVDDLGNCQITPFELMQIDWMLIQ